MDDSLYSNSYESVVLDDSISPALLKVFAQIASLFPDQTLRVCYWNKDYLAVPVTVHVNLPTRGAVDDIDIREEEPIILVFHRDRYPYQSPGVYSDRRDFPRDRLPHLNPTRQSHPISFCLYRGNFDDWMAEHTISDLVSRVRHWLSDAARNRLIPPGDGWEAIRLDNGLGLVISSPERIENYIHEQWGYSRGEEGFTIVRYRLCPTHSPDPMTDGIRYAIEIIGFVEAKKAARVVETIHKINQHFSSLQSTERHLLGILLWPDRDNICDHYFVDLPNNLGELLEWESFLGLPISKALRVYQSKGYQFLGGIPVVVAIRRPTNLLGKTSDLELLNLVIASKQDMVTENEWNESAAVSPLFHRIPLSIRTARELSRSERLDKDSRVIIFGCGAIGSKFVMHMARAGSTDLTLVDNDELSPHNLVRHSLLSNGVGKNKAVGLGDEITSMFREKVQIKVIEGNGIDVLLEKGKKHLREHKWLVDTTTSSAFLKSLIDLDLPKNIRVMRAELGHEGQIGLMTIEGSSRNPRLDDIYAYLFDLARENQYLSAWLQAEQNAVNNELRFEEISIGIGCHTDTMRLADDTISYHAALFSLGFTKQSHQTSDTGYLQISFLNQEGDVSCLKRAIPKFLVIRAENDPTWEVRISEEVQHDILNLVRQSGRNETGGILIGRINPIRNTIHVTKALPPPPDSRSTPYMFVRGITDVWDVVSQIKSSTGDFIYYVGEWHSHPMGGGQMSETDKETARQLQAVLRPTGLPTHILIATPSELVSHVFSGNTII